MINAINKVIDAVIALFRHIKRIWDVAMGLDETEIIEIMEAMSKNHIVSFKKGSLEIIHKYPGGDDIGKQDLLAAAGANRNKGCD